VPPNSDGAATDHLDETPQATDGDAASAAAAETRAPDGDPLLAADDIDARVPATARRGASAEGLAYDDRDGVFLADDDLDYPNYPNPRRPRRPARRPARRGVWDPDTSDRVFDGATSVGRSVAVGYLSQMRLLADVASNFASSVIDGSVSNGRGGGRRRPALRPDRERPLRQPRPRAHRREYEPAAQDGDGYDGYDGYEGARPEPEGYGAAAAPDPREPSRRDTYARRERYAEPRDRYGRVDRRFSWGEDAADFADDVVDGFLDAWEDAMQIPRHVAADMADSYDRDDYRLRSRDGYDDREPGYDRPPPVRSRRR
jgi:hypothetical protein